MPPTTLRITQSSLRNSFLQRYFVVSVVVVVVAVVVVAVVFIIVLVVLVYVYHLNCNFPHTFHVILLENCAGVLRLVHLHTNGRRGWESKSLPRRPLLPCRMATSKSTLIADRLRQIFTLHNGNTYVNFM